MVGGVRGRFHRDLRLHVGPLDNLRERHHDPVRVDAGAKEADESGECDALLAADPEPHDKQGCERNFRNQRDYDEVGVITKRVHQQK